MRFEQLIEVLNMKPHPEGGFFAETYRHPNTLLLPDGRKRNLFTSIYFLLTGKDISHFHRLTSDETWFFHFGENIELVTLENGKHTSQRIGNDITLNALPQLLIPANTWFAAHIPSKQGYALVSCTVSPGFDFDDFELATEEKLITEGWELEDELKGFIIKQS